MQELADESHVVVERQPAAHPDAGTGAECFLDGPLVGEQTAVGDDHAARVTGGAGGVLEVGDRVRSGHEGLPGLGGVGGGGAVGQEADDVAVSGAGEQLGDLRGLVGGGEHADGGGLLDDPGDAVVVVAAPAGRGDGYGDGSRVQAGEEAGDEQGA